MDRTSNRERIVRISLGGLCLIGLLNSGAEASGSALDAVSGCAAFRAAPAVATAQSCRLSAERALGPDAPDLVGVYAAIAESLARDADAALNALPYRRRALDLATALHGPISAPAAEASLAFARSLILSGRCTPSDARLEPLLDAAAAGYMGLAAGDPARGPGLAAAARAYADGWRYAQAAETLAALERATFEDWMRIGGWRRRAEAMEGAAAAFEAALALAEADVAAAPPDDQEARHARARALKQLKVVLFALGDLERLRALDAR